MENLTPIPIRSTRAGNCNVYLLINGSRSVLVDAGMRIGKHKVFELIARSGLEPRDIAWIVITHTHFDHAAGLSALKKATAAKVVVHTIEADFLRQGWCPAPAGATRLGKAMAASGRLIFPLIGRYAPVEPDEVVSSALRLDDLGISACLLPTPGHTHGSLSLVLDGGAAIVGDTLFGIFSHTAFPPFADDVPALLRSWQALLDTGAQVFLPAHGRPVPRRLLERELASRI
jgi:hydroxyacylglutathione hydrolase